MILICLAVCLASTMLGAISGIGGGVIIKPMLDLTLTLGMSRISLLSSMAVLSMSLFSVGKNCVQKDRQVLSMRIAVPLAAGSTAGGIVGKMLFSRLSAYLAADQLVKVVQNGVLFLLIGAVALAAFRTRGEQTPADRTPLFGLLVSLMLGMMSAFLGIGGGPMNMLALTAFYRMRHKDAALYSLFIIVFSQTAGILTALLGGSTLPNGSLIVTACAAGILGGILGRSLSRRMSNAAVRTLYNGALIFILVLCVANIVTAIT